MAKTQRIDKLLANSGYGSRREIKELIKMRRVTINDVIATDAGIHADYEADKICIDGQLIKYTQFVYLMMNKPQGVISATEDTKLRTVIDLLEDKHKKFQVFPVGRLDRDTEGLLLLTNNGALAHNLLAPKKHVSKKYYARVAGNIGNDAIELFKAGITLEDGYKTLPAELSVLNQEEEFAEIHVIIYEGKFHQIKRMFEAVDSKVIFLKRLEMGELRLDESLSPGEYRELTREEMLLIGGEAYE